MLERQLYIGNLPTDVSIFQDAKYPNMWRIRSNGKISDMVNLTRAKDAALSWARPKGLGGSETFRWVRQELPEPVNPSPRIGLGRDPKTKLQRHNRIGEHHG
jgi:hypothetical protein